MTKIQMMKAKIKKKWVEALTSGKYRQAFSDLKERDGYCCLGVLTDLYCKEKKVSFKKIARDNVILPAEVMKWAGLDSSNPLVGGHSLTTWNDNDSIGLNFKAIANRIEKFL